MLESIKEFFQVAPYAAWSILTVLVILIFIAYAWDQVKWWWLNTWMSFPVIGRIARMSKDLDRTHDNAWFKSEKALCSAYMPYVRVMDEHDYHEKVDYLVYAGDNGRTFMPGLLWPVIIAMVFVEAMGFSYVLAGFTIPGASENLQQVGAYGIAFLISAVLIFLTHFAGHELYVNSKINSARLNWIEDNKAYNLGTETVPLAKPQSTDAGQPEYTRIINRIGSKVASYKLTVFAAIFITGVAIGATYVRGQVLEKMLSDEVVGKAEQIHIASDGLDMSLDIKLPASDKAQDQAAQQGASSDSINTERHGGWGTFIVLAFIFLGLQLLSIFFGFRWGFAGQNSKEAFKAIGGGRYATYAEVLDQYYYVCDAAQEKLEDLQQRMVERNSLIGSQSVVASKKTFADFIAEKRKETAVDRENQRDHSRNEDQARKTVASQPASAPIFDIETTLKELNKLDSKEDKKKFIAALSEVQQADVMNALKAAKESEAAKAAKLNSELDGLL